MSSSLTKEQFDALEYDGTIPPDKMHLFGLGHLKKGEYATWLNGTWIVQEYLACETSPDYDESVFYSTLLEVNGLSEFPMYGPDGGISGSCQYAK
jgi:hypothetical protein